MRIAARIRMGKSISVLIAVGALSLLLSGCPEEAPKVCGTLWTHDFGADPICSYLALIPDSSFVVATGMFGRVEVVSAEDGHSAWSASYADESFLMPPVATPEGDICLLSESGHVIYLRRDGDSWTQAWMNAEYSRDINTPLMVQKDYLYAFYNRHHLLVQFDRATGTALRTKDYANPPSDPRDAFVSETQTVRAGDSRVFVIDDTTDYGTSTEGARIDVLDENLAVVREIDLGIWSWGTPTSSPSKTSVFAAYHIVRGDSLFVWSVETDYASSYASTTQLICRRIDADGTDAVVGQVALPYGYPGDVLENSSGRILFGDDVTNSIIDNGILVGSVYADLALPQNWVGQSQSGPLCHSGVWDANGKYYFAMLVGEQNTPRETRIFELDFAVVVPGSLTVAAELLYTLPPTVLHTNLLLLPGKFIVGTKDGMLYCFPNDSPGVDPAAVRPVYYQTQANWGRSP